MKTSLGDLAKVAGVPPELILFSKRAPTTLFLSITQIDEIVRTIDRQIGASTSKYNLTVKPEIHIVAETGTQQVFLQWVVYQRAFSYVVTVVTISFLAITTWFYIKTKLGKPSKSQ